MTFQLNTFATSLVKLTNSVGTEHFYSHIENLFVDWFDFDELLVLKLNKSADAEVLYRYTSSTDVGIRLQGEESWRYLTRLYVLDPFYRLFADKNQYGFFALDDIAPDEFANIYSSYFNFLELTDEIGFIFPVDDNSCLHIDMSRFNRQASFEPEILNSMQALFEPLSSLVSKHIELTNDNKSYTGVNVEQLLVNFGKDLLTNKEYQVCQLLLQGHSAKAIASIMEISYETVKMHKKNIYGKSFLSSQPELLALFIDTIQQDNLDPTIDYLLEHTQEG